MVLSLHTIHLEQNKYGTRTGVAELMRDQLDGDFSKINAAERDNAGAVCKSGVGMLFFMYLICLHYFFKGGGVQVK